MPNNSSIHEELVMMDNSMPPVLLRQGRWYPECIEDNESINPKKLFFEVNERNIGSVAYTDSCIHEPFYWRIEYLVKEACNGEYPSGYALTLNGARKIIETIYENSVPLKSSKKSFVTSNANNQYYSIATLVNETYELFSGVPSTRWQLIQVSNTTIEVRFQSTKGGNELMRIKYSLYPNGQWKKTLEDFKSINSIMPQFVGGEVNLWPTTPTVTENPTPSYILGGTHAHTVNNELTGFVIHDDDTI